MRRMFESRHHRRVRRMRAAAGIICALGALGFAAYWFFLRPAPDVHHGKQVPFKPVTKPKKVKSKQQLFEWPFYGYDRARTRYLATNLKPPFKPIWFISGQVLLEFSPVLAKGVLYLAKNNGAVWAVHTGDGSVIWKKKVGEKNASSPAYSKGSLFVAMLSQQVMALRARDGYVRWQWHAPGRIESSPLVIGNSVYLGSEDGTLYAIDAKTGKKKWTFQANGAIKAAVAYADGKLYFGTYGGSMYAVKATNGKPIWSSNQGGTFYATPAVAFGRVYAGNTDGKVYSFSSSNGQLAWSLSTGSYVYAAAAVAQVPGTRPSVYVGSYDGNFYALDARTGAIRWSHASGGKISGAATVIGNVVYFANLGSHKTVGLSVADGKPVFSFKTGGFNPVISDGKRIYLTGYSSLWGLKERPMAATAGAHTRSRP